MTATDPASPEEIQQRIRTYRNRLLAGRGPGASPAETAPFMRDRQRIGGVPAAVARQQEADQAALAGDDPPAVEDVLIRQRAQLSATLTILTARLHTLRTRAVIGLRVSLIAAAAGAAAALAAQAALRRPAWRRASITGDRPGIGRPQTATRQLRPTQIPRRPSLPTCSPCWRPAPTRRRPSCSGRPTAGCRRSRT